MKKIVLIMFLVALIVPFVMADSDYAKTKATFLNQDPDPAEPGQYVELRWKVEKLGNNLIEDLQYKLELEYPFSLDKGDDGLRDLGDWKGNSDEDEFYTLYYKVKVADDALEDTYKIKLKSTHGLSSPWQSEDFDIRVGNKEKAKFVVGSITTSPLKLTPDLDQAELNINLENIGDGDAENAKFELELPKGFEASYSYSDRDVLGTVEAGKSKTATFYVDVDDKVKGGDYQAKAKILYKDKNDEDDEYKLLTLPFTIHLKEAPRFEITKVDVVSGEIYPGSPVEVKLTVKNIGGEEGNAVSIRAFKESSQPFDFDEKSDYIGKLAAGETGEAVVKLNVDKDATPKDYLLDLEIRSIDGSEVVIDNKQFMLNIAEGKEKSGLPSWIVPLIIAMVFALAGYYFGKNKKK